MKSNLKRIACLFLAIAFIASCNTFNPVKTTVSGFSLSSFRFVTFTSSHNIARTEKRSHVSGCVLFILLRFLL